LEDAKEPTSSNALRANKGNGKTTLGVSKNEDDPLLNYLLENTTSKLKNNFMLFDP
jgi:hypothetical protein